MSFDIDYYYKLNSTLHKVTAGRRRMVSLITPKIAISELLECNLEQFSLNLSEDPQGYLPTTIKPKIGHIVR